MRSSGKPKQTLDLDNGNSGRWCGDLKCIQLVFHLTKIGRFIKLHRTGKAAEKFNQEHKNDALILSGEFENYNNVKQVGLECGMKCKECTVFFFKEQPEIFTSEPEIYLDDRVMDSILKKIHRLITLKFFHELLQIEQYRYDMNQLKELYSVAKDTYSNTQLISLFDAKTLTQVLFAHVINRNPKTYLMNKEEINTCFNDYIRSEQYQEELETELQNLLDITKS